MSVGSEIQEKQEPIIGNPASKEDLYKYYRYLDHLEEKTRQEIIECILRLEEPYRRSFELRWQLDRGGKAEEFYFTCSRVSLFLRKLANSIDEFAAGRPAREFQGKR